MLTKEQLLASKIDLEEVKLDGGTVFVRGMTATERDQWEQLVLYQRKKSPTESCDQFRAALVVRTVCNDKGERLFSDKEIEAVGKMSAKIVDKLWDVAARLSGITEKAMEDLEKNSQTGPSAGST